MAFDAGFQTPKKKKEEKKKREKLKIFQRQAPKKGAKARPYGAIGARNDAPDRAPRSPLLASLASPDGGKGISNPSDVAQRRGMLRASAKGYLNAKNRLRGP